MYILWNDDVITPRPAHSQTPLRHITATTLKNTERFSFYEVTLTQMNKCIVPCLFSCCCVELVYSAQGLCACFKSSSLFLVYLCARITAPHTGLACVLHRFKSVSWFLLYADMSWDEEQIKDRIGKALALCGCGSIIYLFIFAFLFYVFWLCFLSVLSHRKL